MQKECMDGFCTRFYSYDSMLDYHRNLSSKSVWMRKKVNDLYVAALDRASSLAGSLSLFAPGTSEEAVEDTVSNVGLAMQIDGEYYPVRTTAYKSLLERAKISGTALPKPKREDLANVLNACLRLFQSEALKGISRSKLEKICDSYMKNRGARDVVAFLTPHGITPNRAVQFYQEYGSKALEIVRNHPYQLCAIDGIGFKTADKIALSMGFSPQS